MNAPPAGDAHYHLDDPALPPAVRPPAERDADSRLLDGDLIGKSVLNPATTF